MDWIVLKPTLNILEEYTIIHFKTEEGLLREAGYEGLDEHILLHNALIEKTRKIAREATTYKEPELALKFLRNWWIGHINNEDKQYSQFVIDALDL